MKLLQEEYSRHEMLDRLSVQIEVIGSTLLAHDSLLICNNTFKKKQRNKIDKHIIKALVQLQAAYQLVDDIHI